MTSPEDSKVAQEQPFQLQNSNFFLAQYKYIQNLEISNGYNYFPNLQHFALKFAIL